MNAARPAAGTRSVCRFGGYQRREKRFGPHIRQFRRYPIRRQTHSLSSDPKALSATYPRFDQTLIRKPGSVLGFLPENVPDTVALRLVGGQGIPLEEFLSTPAGHWLE